MQQIAALAGVSRAAVSVVINNKKGTIRLSDSTRRRIEAVLRKTTFRPSTVGRALKSGRSMVIGLVVNDPAHSFVPQAIRAVEDFTETRGYGVLLMTTRYDRDREAKVLDYLLDRRVDGVIIGYTPTPKTLTVLKEKKVPAACVFTQLPPPDGHAKYICVDGARIGELASRHLWDLGHRHIACVNMMECIKEGLAKTVSKTPGLKIDYWSFPPAPLPSPAILARWLKTRRKPTAMFILGDELACSVLNAGLRQGLQIPRQLALVGLDDIPMAAQAILPLTTVGQPKYEQGWAAARVLFDMIAGRPGENVIFQPSLIIRQTT